jgi:hypothetical protein
MGGTEACRAGGWAWLLTVAATTSTAGQTSPRVKHRVAEFDRLSILVSTLFSFQRFMDL